MTAARDDNVSEISQMFVGVTSCHNDSRELCVGRSRLTNRSRTERRQWNRRTFRGGKEGSADVCVGRLQSCWATNELANEEAAAVGRSDGCSSAR